MQRALALARDNNVESFEATPESEQWWAEETERTGKATVMYTEGKKAKAWFLGDNVPGKPEAILVRMGGGQVYSTIAANSEEPDMRRS